MGIQKFGLRERRSKHINIMGSKERDAFSVAASLLVEIMDHFAELLVAHLAVTVFVNHSDELVHLPELLEREKL